MDLTALLSPERMAREAEVSSKKRAFEILARLLAQGLDELGADVIFNALTNREKLGSTAVGNGVTIPHACLPLSLPRAALLVVDEGIRMDTPDKKPVHILMALLVPADEVDLHTHLLTDLTHLLANKELCEQVCHFRNSQSMLNYFSTVTLPDNSPPSPSTLLAA